MELDRTGEEEFGRDREVLGRVGGAVAPDEPVAAAPPEPPEVGAEGLVPRRFVLACRQRWHAVGRTVELVELVGELVVDDVDATIGVGDLPGRGPPVEQHRPAPVPRLTREVLGARGDDTACGPGPVTACHDRAPVDDDRTDVEVRVRAGLEPRRQQCSVGSDRVDHGVGDDDVAGALPACVGDQAFAVHQESLLLVGRQPPELGRGRGPELRSNRRTHGASVPPGTTDRRSACADISKTGGNRPFDLPA